MSDLPAYPEAIQNLAAQIPANVSLSPVELAYFKSSIPQEKARSDGARFESVTVLDEVIRIGKILVASVVANEIAGYGPLRGRYFLDTAADLASKVGLIDTSRVEASGAGAARVTSLVGSRDARTQAVRILKNLAGFRPEEKARLKKARTGKEKADERVRSLEALAKELEAALAKVPASIAQDAGATPGLVAALRASASSVLGTKGSAQDVRGSIASLYDEMNELDGRLIHELRLLVGAARDARKTNKAVPSVKCPLIKSGSRKKDSPSPAADNQAPAVPDNNTPQGG